jgi:hypothetical protein
MSSSTASETWQAGIDPQFVQQLQGQVTRSRVISPQLSQHLWARSQFSNSQKTLSEELIRRYIHSSEWQVDSLPIVYAEPSSVSNQPVPELRADALPARRQPLPITRPLQQSSSQSNPQSAGSQKVIQAKMLEGSRISNANIVPSATPQSPSRPAISQEFLSLSGSIPEPLLLQTYSIHLIRFNLQNRASKASRPVF